MPRSDPMALARSLDPLARVAPQYLQACVNEYRFRFNRRFWQGKAFLRAIMLMMQPSDTARSSDHSG
jgi:hypothetical protein